MQSIMINDVSYKIIENHCEQLGDDSCYDRGVKVFTISDGKSIYSFSYRYEMISLDEEANPVYKHEDLQFNKICDINELLNQ